MDKPKSQNQTVASFWNDSHKDAAGGAHDNYLNHPLIQAYVSLRAFGSLTGHLDAAIQACRTNSDPGDTIVSLGCGAALKERILAALEAYSVLDVATDMKHESVLPLTSAKTLLTSNKTVLRPLVER